MNKYLVKIITCGATGSPMQTAQLMENFLNENCEHYELWDYEWLNERSVSIVMRKIESREETLLERYTRMAREGGLGFGISATPDGPQPTAIIEDELGDH